MHRGHTEMHGEKKRKLFFSRIIFSPISVNLRAFSVFSV